MVWVEPGKNPSNMVVSCVAVALLGQGARYLSTEILHVPFYGCTDRSVPVFPVSGIGFAPRFGCLVLLLRMCDQFDSSLV